MKSNRAHSRQLILFFVLSLVLSYLLWLSPVLNAQGMSIPIPLMILGQLAVLGPAIIAFALAGVFEGKTGVKDLLRRAWSWKFKKIWLLAILLLPFATTAGAWGIKLLIEQNAFEWGIAPASIPLTAVIIFFAGGPLEEFGWRGFALPRLLKTFPAVPASLLLGVIHAIWHLPLCFISGTVQSAIPFWEFAVVTIIGAVLYTWIYQNTGGSLSAMMLYHWAGNLGSALFVYYDTMAGRWIFFGLQVAIVLAVIIRHRGWRNLTRSGGDELRLPVEHA